MTNLGVLYVKGADDLPRNDVLAVRYLSKAVDKETASLDSKTFEKHWLVLVEAERAARALRGALCVFCKSGKDRTGMAVTLAAAMFVGEAATSPARATTT